MSRTGQRALRGALAMLLLVNVACGRSCLLNEGETEFEKLDGKVNAVLVRDAHFLTGMHWVIRVETTPPFDQPIDCDHVEMAEDDTGKSIAYRCKGTRAWNLIRLHGGDHHVVECKAPVGTDKKPDFSRVEPVSQAADRVLDCLVPGSFSGPEIGIWSDLALAIEEEEGAARAIEVMGREAERTIQSADRDPWWVATSSRSALVRDGVLAIVCSALLRDAAAPSLYVRAALHCGFEEPYVGATAVAQMARRLAAPIPIPPGSTYAGRLAVSDSLALTWSAVIAVARAPHEAGAAACAAAPALVDSQDDIGSRTSVAPRRVAGAVIAATGTRCDAVKPWLEQVPCASWLDCDDHLCTQKELGRQFETWAAATHAPLIDFSRDTKYGDAMAPPEPPRPEVIRLALAYLLGPLDREITVRNARRRYEALQSDTETECDAEGGDAGAPCKCTRFNVGWDLCAVPAKDTRGVVDTCSFRIDDARKRVDDFRRVLPSRDL